MYIGKKKIKLINQQNYVHDVIETIMGMDSDFLKSCPDTWDSSEKQIYDIACEINDKVLSNVVKIIKGEIK